MSMSQLAPESARVEVSAPGLNEHRRNTSHLVQTHRPEDGNLWPLRVEIDSLPETVSLMMRIVW